MNKSILFALVLILSLFSSCKGDLENITYSPSEYQVEGTEYLGIFPDSETNPLTHEGVKLGQHLFFDNILSSTNTMSCSSCHDPQKAFTDGNAVSVGVDGIAGSRSSMSLVNAAYYTKGLFWDGRSATLEEQALLPVEDEIELHHDWGEVEKELRNHEMYPRMFREAFGIEDSDEITKELAARALAQFQRIIISGNSPFDRFWHNQGAISDEASDGHLLFFEIDQTVKDAECGHCHNYPLMTSNEYFDNGLQDAQAIGDYRDIGLARVTGLDKDYGKMRAPTLRNIALTAPYMHDGRFETLEEVMDHYNRGGNHTVNQDVLVDSLFLTEEQKSNIIAFMHSLTDTSYLENPYLQNPFK